MSPKWHLAYFVPIDGHFGQIGTYITFDIQTNFEVNRTQIGHSIPKNTPKSHSNGHISKTHFAQKPTPSTFLNELSGSFRINVNMDFAHTIGG